MRGTILTAVAVVVSGVVMGTAAAMVWVSVETKAPAEAAAPAADTASEPPAVKALFTGGNFTAVGGMIAHASLEKRLGDVDSIKDVAAGVDMSTGITIYRFQTDMGRVVTLASQLNLTRGQMLSAADHGLARSDGHPSWWHPEKEMKCCTRFTGSDAKKTGALFIGYNNNTGVAYVVFLPREKPQFPPQRR